MLQCLIMSARYTNTTGSTRRAETFLFVAYDRSPGSRKIVYRLGILALKINDIEEASDCYEEFVKLAPKDPNQYILKYKILKARRAPVSEQIAALEDFKKAEYVEKWAYELAKLYDEAGMTAECLEECDDLILWFSEGKYVYQAMELKMKYKPLTPLQQEKYNSMGGQKTGRREMVRASAEEDVKPQEAEEEMQDELEEAEDSLEQEDIPEVKESGTLSEEEAATREIRLDELRAAQEKAKEEMAAKPKEKSSIRQTVKGATLSEALANGVRVAKGLDIEEKASTKQDEAMRITAELNNSYHSPEEVRDIFSRLTGNPVDESFKMFPPFYTECGKNIHVGKNVFINFCCHFQDQGGIFVGDETLIGHNVVIATLNHDFSPEHRASMHPAPVHIGKGVWIGSHATIVPGVTIGDHAVITAGAVVTKDVPHSPSPAGFPRKSLNISNRRIIMSKNILILSSSPRKGGNSDILADEFAKGSTD